MLLDDDLESSASIDGLLLIEDVQLGLSALNSSIYSRSLALATDELDKRLRRWISTDTLEKRLRNWKELLFRLPFQQTDYLNGSQEQHMSMRFYYGFEDHSVPGWQALVFARPKALFFDALMLYHVLNLNLHADMRSIRQLARDLSNDYQAYGVPYQEARLKREADVKKWTASHFGRQALSYCASILVAYNNLSGLENKLADPIAYIALSLAALVIWAYCTFGHHDCVGCSEPDQLHVGQTVELTRLCELGSQDLLREEREAWIGNGGGRIMLVGTQVCGCDTDALLDRFRSCLPEGWEVLSSIAPGIFKR